MSFLKLMGSGGMSESDDLETVTRQLRKYAIEGNTSTVFAMDNTHALYLHFSDAGDENAAVEFAVATSGEDEYRLPHLLSASFCVFGVEVVRVDARDRRGRKIYRGEKCILIKRMMMPKLTS